MDGKKTLDELLAEPDDEPLPRIIESEDDRKERFRNYYRRYFEKLKRNNPEKLRARWRRDKRTYIEKKRKEGKHGKREGHPILFEHGEGTQAQPSV